MSRQRTDCADEGQGFEQDEYTVSDVCGCCGLQAGDSVIYNLSLYTYCTIVTDNMVKDDDVQVSSSNLDINVSGRCYRQKHRTTTIQ
jgi:hypothetical protein